MLKDKFVELLKKKLKDGDSKLSENEQKAKGKALGDLMSMAHEAMGKGIKKVEVSAPSAEGLKEGLEKAEEIVEGSMPESEESEKEYADGEIYEGDADNYEEMAEDEESEDEESEEMSADAIEAKIAELMKMKEDLKKKEV